MHGWVRTFLQTFSYMAVCIKVHVLKAWFPTWDTAGRWRMLATWKKFRHRRTRPWSWYRTSSSLLLFSLLLGLPEVSSFLCYMPCHDVLYRHKLKATTHWNPGYQESKQTFLPCQLIHLRYFTTVTERGPMCCWWRIFGHYQKVSVYIQFAKILKRHHFQLPKNSLTRARWSLSSDFPWSGRACSTVGVKAHISRSSFHLFILPRCSRSYESLAWNGL